MGVEAYDSMGLGAYAFTGLGGGYSRVDHAIGSYARVQRVGMAHVQATVYCV